MRGSEVMLVALRPNPVKNLVRDRGRQGMAGAEDPDTFFLGKRNRRAGGAQRDAFTGGFQLQRVARRKVEFVPQWLGNHDAAGTVDSQSGYHNAILHRENPFVNGTKMICRPGLRGTPRN